jgi:hypothetical protein
VLKARFIVDFRSLVSLVPKLHLGTHAAPWEVALPKSGQTELAANRQPGHDGASDKIEVLAGCCDSYEFPART